MACGETSPSPIPLPSLFYLEKSGECTWRKDGGEGEGEKRERERCQLG